MAHPTTTPPIITPEPQNGLRIVAISHICKRDENQDTMDYAWNDNGNLLVVADGMGGHSGGSAEMGATNGRVYRKGMVTISRVVPLGFVWPPLAWS